MKDNQWWDTWALVYNGFLHKEFDTEDEALAELSRINRDYPDIDIEIIYTKNAGFGDMRYKMVAVWGIRPIGEFHA